RPAEWLLEQDRADPLVIADQRNGARIVRPVVDRAGERIDRRYLVPPAEIVLSEGDPEELLGGAEDTAHAQHAFGREQVAMLPHPFDLEALARAVADASGDRAELGGRHLGRDVHGAGF